MPSIVVVLGLIWLNKGSSWYLNISKRESTSCSYIDLHHTHTQTHILIHSHRICTMGSLTVGLILFGHQWQLLSSRAWAAVGVVFSMVLYFAKTYTAFFGGQILAIYTMSLWPMLSKRFVSHNPGKAIPLAMSVCFLLTLLSVWVVAYNFVPGGIITRERSDAMLILTTLIIGFASRNVRQGGGDSKVVPSKKHRAESMKRAGMKDQGDNKQITFFGRVFRRLSTITEEGDEDWTETEKGSKTHQARAREVNVAEETEGQKFHNKVIKGILDFPT